jgi:hypothetical protein
MRHISTLLILALSVSLAIAQEAPLEQDPAQEAIRRYKVEVIVFTYEEDVSSGSEVFLADEPPVIEEPVLDDDGYPVISDLLPAENDLIGADSATGEEALPVWTADTGVAKKLPVGDAGSHDLSFVLLGEDELDLGAEIRKFELLDAYKTIMHVGWIQPTYPEEETPAMDLRLLGEPPPGLGGSFTLYLSRYLHLVVDLALDASNPSEDTPVYEEPAFSFGDARSRFTDNPGAKTQPVRYRIQEHRIFKNGELRYFDHPKFGVLAKITRMEDQPEEDVVVIPLISGDRQ